MDASQGPERPGHEWPRADNAAPTVRLVDLEVIKRFSLAVRQDSAPAADVLAALDASRAVVVAAMSAPAKRAAAKKTAGKATSASSKRAPAKRAPAKKAAKQQ